MNKGLQGRHSGRTLFFGLVSAALAQVAAAATADPFFDLNLNEVLNLEITSVSKKPQTISQAAAAVFVITADDIRRSGVTTIADALRMAPGVQVGQISANTWAVSGRGINGRFTNKLLVLMDGRSVYTPTFSGVYWDVQDTVLADIERIEVIRGPGAALWGANAVNGVINIITKSAAATQGGLVTAASGNEESASASVRYGGKAGEIGNWRVYAKGFERDESVVVASGADGKDYWRQQRVGFRTDLAPGGADSVTLQGDYYSGRSGDTATLNFLTPPFNTTLGVSQKVSGGNLLGRWQRDVSATDSFTLQAYFDHTQRDWPAHLNESRNTYDLDFQYRTRRFEGHDVVVGAGYRLNRDRIDRSYTGIPANALQFSTFSPTSANRQLYSALIQDDITLMPERLVLTLGTKLEHNDYTGMEWQPNARLLWTPGDTTTVWGSVARAVRTPSRIDRGGVVNQTVIAPLSAQNPLPLPVLIQATGEIESETLIAYEAGWKQRLAPTLSVDLALFYNDYDKLRTGHFLAPVCQPSGLPVAAGCFMMPFQTYVLQSSPAGNMAKGWSHGIELSADWRPLTNLRFQSALSQFAMEIREQGNAFTTDREGSAPRLQGSLRMSWNPRPDADVDLWLRRIGRLDEVTEGISIPGYTQLDLRLAWRPSKTFELALVGRNLLDRKHPEFASELLDGAMTELQRSVFGQVTLRF